MIDQKRIAGVTLLEVMLVILIGLSLFYMGLQQYYSYKRDAEIVQIRKTVNLIFNSAAQFYYAECYGRINPKTGLLYPGTGRLNLSAIPPPSNPYILDIVADLITPGYLPANAIPAINTLIDDSIGTHGYTVQFNEYREKVQVCQTGTNAWGSMPATGCTTAKQIGTLILWKTQVAVQLKDKETTNEYVAILGGDCLSTVGTTDFSGAVGVVPCAKKPAAGDFVVWERLPSSPNTIVDTRSAISAAMPIVQQFTNMYRTNDVTYLMGISHSPEGNYFYCGG